MLLFQVRSFVRSLSTGAVTYCCLHICLLNRIGKLAAVYLRVVA